MQETDVCTLRGVLSFPIEDQKGIFRAFTRFTYDFHQKGVYFIDHSMGNTLVKKEGTEYSFSLVDVNRTRFTSVSALKGLENLSMLELDNDMLRIIGEEYAMLASLEKEMVINRLIDLTSLHKKHVARKSFIRNTRRKIKHFLFP